MMEKANALRERALPVALTLLRVTVGVVMVAHGWTKLTNLDQWVGNLSGMGIPAPEIAVWLAIAGELGGGLGLIVGLLTPVAALGVFFAMLTAILSVHIDNGLFARDGGFEYPLTVMMAALFFAMRGAGPLSLDALVARTRHPSAGERSSSSSARSSAASAAQ